VSVIDMASAYSVFASGGYKTPAYGITKISSLRGEVIAQVDPDAPRERILSEDTVVKMDQMMYGVVNSGTGTRARIQGVPVLGKTGTTNSYRDAWFCGFTGNYVAAVWLGNDDYGPTNNLTGGTLPTIAWQKFMAYAHTNAEIKPVLGVDFKPATPVVIADAAGNPVTPVVVERPPTLKPEAAQKLLDLADRLHDSLLLASPVAQQTPPAAAAPSESL
jgi:penicillin-binding protein 1A